MVALGLVIAACGGTDSGDGASGSSSGGSTSGSTDGGSTSAEPSVITFAFAPDPVIDYLIDTGVLAEMEEEWNIKLEMTEAWDEFAFFAGGHGQVVSMATYDLQLLERETGVETVTFGKYNMNRLPVLVRADSPYQTLADLVGQTVAVGSVSSSTLIWGMLAAEIHDVDLRFEGGDFEVILSDHAVNPELLARGEFEACICIPEFATPQLRSGEVRALYDGMGAAELYAAQVDAGHAGILSNGFTAEKEWYDSHPREVEFFLTLWERGIQLWQENQADIIARYPQHFSVESPEDIEFIQQWIAEHDWFVDTVYIDDEWIAGETGMFAKMREHGFASELEPGESDPEFQATAAS